MILEGVEERYTYDEIHEKVLLVAGMMKNMYKVGKGDRVGILARNLPEWIVFFWVGFDSLILFCLITSIQFDLI